IPAAALRTAGGIGVGIEPVGRRSGWRVAHWAGSRFITNSSSTVADRDEIRGDAAGENIGLARREVQHSVFARVAAPIGHIHRDPVACGRYSPEWILSFGRSEAITRSATRSGVRDRSGHAG